MKVLRFCFGKSLSFISKLQLCCLWKSCLPGCFFSHYLISSFFSLPAWKFLLTNTLTISWCFCQGLGGAFEVLGQCEEQRRQQESSWRVLRAAALFCTQLYFLYCYTANSWLRKCFKMCTRVAFMVGRLAFKAFI